VGTPAAVPRHVSFVGWLAASTFTMAILVALTPPARRSAPAVPRRRALPSRGVRGA